MAIALIIAVISLPILELLLLIKIGGSIGLLPLLLLLVGMAVAGGLVLRHQGLAVARRAMDQLSRNEPPVQSMIDGIGLTIAGVLMLIPGLISDVAGLLLLVPAIRRPLIGRLIGAASLRWDVRAGAAGRKAASGEPRQQAPDATPDPATGGVVIDGEFERLEERTLRPGRRPNSNGPSPNGANPNGANPNGAAPPTGSPWRR
jgi:UPF0716 protein FxsA